MGNKDEIKVSIISPCYNGENYISRFLDSVVNQTHRNIELIIINDGSKDKTEDIILSYKKKIEDQGFIFIYLKQENMGQSAAINQALPIFTGNYVSFVDSDDYLSDDAVEKKVAYMETHPEIGLLVNKIKTIDFDTQEPIGLMERKKPDGKDHLFADLISGNNVFYTPGGYFWRSSMFRDAMPKPLQIVAPREIGQNFQLILPIAYKYPIGYLDEYLYYYLVRKGSHSRTKHTYEEALHNWDVAKTVLTHIADDIEKNAVKRKHIQRLIDERYLREQMKISHRYGMKIQYKKYLDKWIQMQVGNNKIKAYYLRTRLSLLKAKNSTKSWIAKKLSF